MAVFKKVYEIYIKKDPLRNDGFATLVRMPGVDEFEFSDVDTLFHDFFEHMEGSVGGLKLPRLGTEDSEGVAAGVSSFLLGRWITPYGFTPSSLREIIRTMEVSEQYNKKTHENIPTKQKTSIVNLCMSVLPPEQAQDVKSALRTAEIPTEFYFLLLGVYGAHKKYGMKWGQMAEFRKTFVREAAAFNNEIKAQMMDMDESMSDEILVGVIADPQKNFVEFTDEIDDSFMTVPTVTSSLKSLSRKVLAKPSNKNDASERFFYHGTQHKFDNFKLNHDGFLWLALNRKFSEHFTQKHYVKDENGQRKEGRMLQVQLKDSCKLIDITVFDDPNVKLIAFDVAQMQWRRMRGFDKKMRDETYLDDYADFGLLEGTPVAEALKEAGYDGAICWDSTGGSDKYKALALWNLEAVENVFDVS